MPTDPSSTELAWQLYRAGDRGGAQRACRARLEHDPNDADARYLLGIVAADAGQWSDAVQQLTQATAVEPRRADFHHALGEVCRLSGDRTRAVDCFRQAIGLDPRLVASQHALGLALFDLGDARGAIEAYRRALALDANHARAHLNLGRAWQTIGDVLAAAESYRAALRVQPDYAIAHNNLGALLTGERRATEAIGHLRRALELQADYPEAHYNLGNALYALDDPTAACASYRAALRLRPQYAHAQLQLGVALEALHQLPEALAAYQTLLGFHPQHGEGWQRLARLLLAQRNWDHARAALEQAARYLPHDVDVLPNLAYVKRMTCDWSTLEADDARLWQIAEARLAAGQPTGVPPFFALAMAWSAERQRDIAAGEARQFAARHAALGRELAAGRTPGTHDRLRLAYLSGDFYDHAVGHLVQRLFGLHDRRRFEVFAYSYGPDDGSVYRQRIQTDCEHFVDIRCLSLAELARRIAADEIDILVDLMGYSGFTRFEVLAARPATVQVSWLGFPGTTGADFVDFLITDAVVSPPELAACYSEQLARLPHSYLLTDDQQPRAAEPARREDYGLPSEGFVFCSWNNSYKIEPRIFETWMRVLGQVPGSVLWLYSAGPTMEANLRLEASARGIAPERLVFGYNLSPKARHLARLALADLFLDTPGYNAQASAADALWAGLPLLACPGRAFATRVSASLLTALGLPELIVRDLGEYERLATRLGRQPGELRLLREKLAAQRATQPLFDTPRFVGDLEAAYDEMWRSHCER